MSRRFTAAIFEHNTVVTICFFIVSICTFSAKAIEIKVVTEYLKPYQIKKDDNTLGGFSTEVIHALFELTGDKPNIKVMPWARTYHTVMNSQNMMVYSLARTKLREPLFKWVGKLHREQLYVWGLKSKFSRPFTTLDELKPFSFATSRGSNPEQYLTKHDFTKLYRLGNVERNIQMLFSERVDFIISAEFPVKLRCKKMKFDCANLIKLFDIPELNSDLSVAFNLDTDPAIVERFQHAFKKLEKTGVVTALRKKWSLPY